MSLLLLLCNCRKMKQKRHVARNQRVCKATFSFLNEYSWGRQEVQEEDRSRRQTFLQQRFLERGLQAACLHEGDFPRYPKEAPTRFGVRRDNIY